MSVAKKTRCLVQGMPTDVEVSYFEINREDAKSTFGHGRQFYTKALEVYDCRE